MHVATALVYAIFIGLAIASFATSQALFRSNCEVEGDALYCPIHFCGFTSGTATIQAIQGADDGCFDKAIIGMLVPTATVLSIVAIVTLSLFDVLARCRGDACGMSHAFNDGVVAGMSLALVFLLFVTALILFGVALLGDYFRDQYGQITNITGSVGSTPVDFRVELSGNIPVLYAAGAFCLLAALLTIVESALLCR